MRIRYRVLICIALIGISLLALDRLYTFALLSNQNLKLSSVASHPRNATLLIHGPCEPLWIVSPELIDALTQIPSYNLAQSHSDFADNYLHLYLYLKNNQPPRHMLLYVTPESFDKRYNVFNSYRFAPYLDDPVVAAVVRENDPEYFRWTKVPFLRYAFYGKRLTFQVVQGLKHFFTARQQAYYHDGFEPPARRVWGNHKGKFVQLYEEGILFRKDTLREKYFLKLLRLAKQKGTEVILYESPVLEEALPHQQNRDSMVTYIRWLAAREGIEYIQFAGLEMARDRSYFNSALTLNMTGVEVFNDTLARFLKLRCVRDTVVP